MRRIGEKIEDIFGQGMFSLLLENSLGKGSGGRAGLFHKEKLNVGKRPLCRELWVLYKCSMTLDILRL